MNKSVLIFLIAGAGLLAALFLFFKPPAVPVSAPVIPASVATQVAVIAPAAPTPEPVQSKTFDLVVKRRKLVSGPEVLQVNQGDTVIINIICDQAEELHLHGYNKKVDLEPNKPATLKFVADRSGRFEYELEKSRVEMGALEVQPQ